MEDYLPERGYKRVLVLALYLLIGAGAAYLAFRYLAGALAPFLAALVTAALLRPMARRIAGLTRMSARAAGTAALLLLLIALSALTVWLTLTLISQASGLLLSLAGRAEEAGARMTAWLEGLLARLPLSGEAERQVWRDAIGEGITQAASGLIVSLTSALPGYLGAVLSSLPGILLFLTVYLITAFSLCFRYEEVTGRLMSLLPPLGVRLVRVIKVQSSRIGMGYLKSALGMLALTLIQLYLGLSLLGVPYALVISVVIALVDLLPVLGAGTVLVPWAILALMGGESSLCAGLLLLLALITLTRQLIEPRMVGRSFGISPLLTVTAMYAGWYLGGVLGMLLLPGAVTLLAQFLPSPHVLSAQKKDGQS